MAEPVDFTGTNLVLNPPAGEEDRVGGMRAFTNGNVVVSCWQLTPEEIEFVMRTGRIFVGQWSGQTIFPTYVGDERSMRAIVADYGRTIPRQAEQA